MLCGMGDVEMRAVEDRAERPGPSTNSSSAEPMNINPSEAERDEQRNASPISELVWELCCRKDARIASHATQFPS